MKKRETMNANCPIAYLGYQITVAQDKARFTAKISRDGGLISHDGRNSEVWAGKAESELWEQRTRLVKEELDFERAASVAKTIKLKALRLEKTRVDAEQELQTNRFIPTVVTDPRQGGR